MNEKQSKRISKGKGGRRRKSVAPPVPPKYEHLVKAKPSAVPMARAGGRHRHPEPKAEEPFPVRPDAALETEFAGTTVITHKFPHHQLKYQDALEKVDASFDFSAREPAALVQNFEVPSYAADPVIPDEHFLTNDFRCDNHTNENSFLHDSILKVNRSFGSRSDGLNGSNSLLGSRFIRKTSGRRSPGPLLFMDGCREFCTTIGQLGDVSINSQERLVDGSLFRTLPNQGDMSYEILPFTGRDVFDEQIKIISSRNDSHQDRFQGAFRKSSRGGENEP